MRSSHTNKNQVNSKKKLLDQMRDVIRRKHYSVKTEKTYISWAYRFIKFHRMRHPKDMGVPEIEMFLSDLAVRDKVAASTQNQAFNAILFLYRHVIGRSLEGKNINAIRAKRKRRAPVVMSKEEVGRVISLMNGKPQLMAKILYGSGLRLMECIRLRVHNIDFHMKEITVRDGKGGKDRITFLPDSIIPALQEHLQGRKIQHKKDIAEGYGSVQLPNALARKYPDAHKEWGWQFVFASGKLSTDPISGIQQRHHIHENTLQKAVRKAALAAGIVKPISPHIFRHSFATHMRWMGLTLEIFKNSWAIKMFPQL